MSAGQPAEPSFTDAMWTVADIARVLKTSKSWIYKAAERGTIPCVKIGAMLRFEPAVIRAWLDARKASDSLEEASSRK